LRAYLVDFVAASVFASAAIEPASWLAITAALGDGISVEEVSAAVASSPSFAVAAGALHTDALADGLGTGALAAKGAVGHFGDWGLGMVVG
jgi:hypothetical protein